MTTISMMAIIAAAEIDIIAVSMRAKTPLPAGNSCICIVLPFCLGPMVQPGSVRLFIHMVLICE